MTRRRAARFAAIQALYQAEVTGRDAEAIVLEFHRHRLADLLEPLEGEGPQPEVDRAFFVSLTRGAFERIAELDPVIEANLAAGWTLHRIGYLLRALLRAGAYELAARPDVPVSVVIDEYVALAHDFVSSDQAGFVNAVLDRLAARLRPGAESTAPAPT